MKQHVRIFFGLASLLAVAACHRPAESAFYNRGGPEALLDVSSEVVNLSVAGPNELSQLSSWVERDQPSRAELYCNAGEPRCKEARKVLELHGIPIMVVAAGDNTVALVYERVLARDCNPRFVDNTHNNYNGYHKSFGCSTSANVVQEVSDKQQFVNPNLSDNPRANGAISAYGRAYVSPETPKAYGVDESIVAKGKTE